MLTTLRIVLIVLGVSAIAIAGSDIFLGPDFTAGGAEQVYGALTGYAGPASGHWPATMDNEMRFYSALWGAYGVVLLMVARDLSARGHLVPWLAGVFFAGGLGRVISWLSVGPPHPFFTLLMAIELILPVGIVLLWLARGDGAREPLNPDRHGPDKPGDDEQRKGVLSRYFSAARTPT